MPDLNIRNVALELIVELKKSALDHGVTLREFCIGVLSGPRLGFVAKKAGVAQTVERSFDSVRKVEGSIPSPRSKKVKAPVDGEVVGRDMAGPYSQMKRAEPEAAQAAPKYYVPARFRKDK